MEHSFDIDIAKEYGIPCAVILKHLWYWIEKNRANRKNERDGSYWTYNSVSAFCELFPYLSKNTIIRALKKLSDEGIIKEAVFNDVAFDRTKWYAITDKGYSIINGGLAQNAQCHLPKMSKSDLPKLGEPIPNKYQINTQINNISNSKELDCPSGSEERSVQAEVKEVISAWNKLSDYGIAPVKKIGSGSKRASCLRARLREYGIEDVLTAIANIRESDFLKGKNNRGWIITFDWFVLPTNFPKVLEGNYNNRNGSSEAKSQYYVPTGLEKPKKVWQ
jgi:hypothetical protein